jgi:glycosyltransferase involved in cell wall biosynthesis
MNELVSVIIPTYGGGEKLASSVLSVLDQSYKSIEIIIVDDNGVGTENQILTKKRLEEFLSDPRIIYICHEKNKNGSAARNTGFANSKGEYIALLDDDDIFDKDKLLVQVKSLSENLEYGMSYCSYEKYNSNGKLIETVEAKKSGDLLYPILSHEVSLTSGSLLIRRSVWESVNGFDESFGRHQDWEFVARVASKYKIISVPNVGLRKYMVFRNSARSADQAKAYRNHYLEKMQPYIQQLSRREQKTVMLQNKLDIALMYFKDGRYFAFFKEFVKMKPGIKGIKLLIERFLIKRKKQTVKS